MAATGYRERSATGNITKLREATRGECPLRTHFCAPLEGLKVAASCLRRQSTLIRHPRRSTAVVQIDPDEGTKLTSAVMAVTLSDRAITQ
jgi:hypothetical protein